MKFSLPFFQKKNDSSEYYLGLFLKEDAGVVYYLQSAGSGLKVADYEKFTYTNGWDNLLEDLDEALYKVELRTKKSPEKAIFFIYSHLVDRETKEIRRPYLGKIKEVSKNLELKPMGYIECHEGVLEYLQMKESLPLTAILLEFDKSALGVFVYKGGKLVASQTVVRTHDVVHDVTPVLDKIRAATVLPARIVLYNSSELASQLSKLVTHRWDPEYFIQLPKVEIVSENELVHSLVSIFQQQLSGGAQTSHLSESYPHEEFTQVSTAHQDVSAEGTIEEKEVMGFVIGGDVAPKQAHQPELPQHSVQPALSTEKFEESPSSKEFSLAALFAPITSRLRHLNLPPVFKDKKLMTIALPLAAILLIALAVFLIEYFLHSAKVTVYFPAQEIEKDIVVNASKTSGKNTLALSEAKAAVAVNEAKNTTGKKEIGEKAEGEVTVHNFDDREHTFDKGTALSAKGLEFALSDTVKVASSSIASDGSAKLPGKAKGGVTAASIGAEGNLAPGAKFKIDTLSESLFFALNEKSLTGGTKKEIRTVAKEDLDSLRQRAADKAKLESRSRVKLAPDAKIIKDLTETLAQNETFSHELGEEADQVTLKASMQTTSVTYNEKELIKKLMDALEPQVKNDFVLKPELIKPAIKRVQTDKTSYKLTVHASAKATRKFDEKELKNSLSGKSEKGLVERLKKDFKASDAEVEIRNPLPFFNQLLPLRPSKIELTISYL